MRRRVSPVFKPANLPHARAHTHTHSHALTLCVCALERQVVDASAWLGALGTVCIEFARRSMGWMRRWRTGLGLGG